MGIGPVSESAVRAQEAQSQQLAEQQSQRAEERSLLEQRQRRLAEERSSTQNTGTRGSRQDNSQDALGLPANARSESTAQTTDGAISADNLTDAARVTQTRENAATVARVGLDSADVVSDAIGRLRESIQANEQAGTTPQPASRGSLVSILV